MRASDRLQILPLVLQCFVKCADQAVDFPVKNPVLLIVPVKRRCFEFQDQFMQFADSAIQFADSGQARRPAGILFFLHGGLSPHRRIVTDADADSVSRRTAYFLRGPTVARRELMLIFELSRPGVCP